MQSQNSAIIGHVLDLAAHSWGLRNGEIKYVRRTHNWIFRWQGDKGVYYIKLTDSKSRPFEEVEAGMTFLVHLSNAKASVAQPVLTIEGCPVVPFENEEISGTVSVTSAASGKPISPSSICQKEFYAWGAALASLHEASTAFDSTSVRFAFNHHECEWKRMGIRLSGASNGIQRKLEEIAIWRSEYLERASSIILTHGDMNPSNVIWDGEKITIIDFDEPILHWPETDIARPFRETWGINDEDRARILAAFLDGYQTRITTHRPYPEDLSNLITLKNLEMFGWLSEEWTSEVTAFGRGKEEELGELEEFILRPLSLEKRT